MGRKPKAKRVEREIQSDDEISDGEPMNEVDKFHETNDRDFESDEHSEVNEFEVAAVADRSDSESENEEFEEHDIEENLPTAGKQGTGFGKNLKNYLHTDFTEKQMRKKKKDEKEELRQLEEEGADEGRDDLYGFLNKGELPQSSDEEEDDDAMEGDESGQSEGDKIKLLKRQSPLLFPLIEEFKIYTDELYNILTPLNANLENADERFIKYVTDRTKVVRSYLINIAFYLRLRSKAAENLEEHPVIDRLTKLRKIIDNITSEKANAYMEAYLDVENSKMKKIKSKISEDSGNENSEESGEEGEEDGEESRELTEEEKKRGITYKMAKNKGLRKKGQKKRRNPRVKHREAYESALKRRKGAVRNVIVDQKTKYTGEASGIRAGVIKSRRIKS